MKGLRMLFILGLVSLVIFMSGCATVGDIKTPTTETIEACTQTGNIFIKIPLNATWREEKDIVISHNAIHRGFSEEDVEAAWGKPEHKQSVGKYDYWYYGNTQLVFSVGYGHPMRKARWWESARVKNKKGEWVVPDISKPRIRKTFLEELNTY